MGSSEGRRQCCMYFWQSGYRAGFTSVAKGNRVEQMPSDTVIGFFANTGSKSFQGLWRMGFAMGLSDREANRKSREFTGYDQRYEVRDGIKKPRQAAALASQPRIRKREVMPKKKRPSVDTHAWDAAETLLELMPKFNALREDIRTDLKWELADRIQKTWEDYCDEQKLND